MSDPTPLPQREDEDASIGLCQGILFDLDGTLADTAPDLAAAVNKMRHERGLEMVPLDSLRPLASAGARGLLGGAFGIGPDHHDYASMRDEFLAKLGLDMRAGCVVSGDTTPHSKPHPAPLLHAAKELALPPERIVYVGDDLRDVQAGFAAGMVTVAAAYGYCGNDIPPTQWHAKHVVNSTAELYELLRDIS